MHLKIDKERKSFIKSYDMFGHAIELNFEGERSHQTCVGGCFSIVIKICIFIYVILNVKKLLLLEDDKIVTQVLYRELADEPAIQLQEVEGLVFWVLQRYSDNDFEPNPLYMDFTDLEKYIFFETLQVSYNYKTKETRIEKAPMKQCTLEDFLVTGQNDTFSDQMNEFYELWEGYSLICADKSALEGGGILSGDVSDWKQ
jgi:hypothetical protein